MSWRKIQLLFYLIGELEAKWYCEWEKKTPVTVHDWNMLLNIQKWISYMILHDILIICIDSESTFDYLVLGYKKEKKLGISGPWKNLGNFDATKRTEEGDDTATMKQRYLQGTEGN